MTKRKNQLADKLSSESNLRPGWRDTIRPSQPVPEVEEEQPEQPKRRARPRLKRKTYLLNPDLIDRIEQIAEEERVGINELVRFLLSTSLDLVEANQLEIPTAPARRRIMK